MIDILEIDCELVKFMLDEMLLSKYDCIDNIKVEVETFKKYTIYYSTNVVIEIIIKTKNNDYNITSRKIWDDVDIYCSLFGLRISQYTIRMDWLFE